MADALRELGFELDRGGARATRSRGQVDRAPCTWRKRWSASPANHDRLEAEGLLDPTAFLVAYLIEGTPGVSAASGADRREAIELIHGAGGVAVWAHPFWDVQEPGAVLAAIDRFRAAGLDGVESFYVTHTREQTELLVDRCAELGLLSTGSSDYHGPEHHTFSAFRAFETYGLEPVLGPLAALSGPGPQEPCGVWASTNVRRGAWMTITRCPARKADQRRGGPVVADAGIGGNRHRHHLVRRAPDPPRSALVAARRQSRSCHARRRPSRSPGASARPDRR